MISLITQIPFTHRTNPDSTQDSICMSCFLTVGSGSEKDLIEAERNHNCERCIQEECVKSEHFRYGPI
jgi:hypothetical protein